MLQLKAMSKSTKATILSPRSDKSQESVEEPRKSLQVHANLDEEVDSADSYYKRSNSLNQTDVGEIEKRDSKAEKGNKD